MNLEWFDYMRMVTMTLALIALWVSGNRARKQWSNYTRRLKELWWAFNAFLVLVIEGSLEQIVFDIGYGPRTFLTFLVTLACLRALVRAEGFIKSEPPLEQ